MAELKERVTARPKIDDPVILWRASELKYRTYQEMVEGPPPAGVGNFANARTVEGHVTDTCFAGYAEFRGGQLNFLEPADEILFVLDGQVTLTANGSDYVGHAGDSFFIRKGVNIRMIGDEESKVAYVSHICGNTH
jgi:ethanolamine utilization protein EutQ (cupin superfamily)